jgi:hypothetical protein
VSRAKTKTACVNAELEKFLSKLMKEAMSSNEMSLTDKMKIADRVLKLEQLKMKLTDDGFGSGFHDDGNESD